MRDDQWLGLIEARLNSPNAAAKALKKRKRRKMITDSQLFIVAADHTARGMLGVGDDQFAMADRRKLLDALMVALENPKLMACWVVPM